MSTLPASLTVKASNGPRLPAEIRRWLPELSHFFAPLDDLLEVGARAEQTRANARAYLLGLLVDGDRKSMEPLAQRAGIPADRLQNFITYSPWDWRLVQARLIQVMAPRFATESGVFSLDDTELPKQGKASVGVAPQYCGVVGKVANCQVAVSLQYVRPDRDYHPNLSSFSLGMELYLPERWVGNPSRRRRARVPAEVVFRTKWQMGLELIDRARGLKVPHRAVVADAGYGTIREFREALRRRGEAYVVGVQLEKLTVRVPRFGNELRSASEVVGEIPADRWVKVRWADGSQGPLEIEATRMRATVAPGGEVGEEEVWLIFERRVNETKAYVAWGLGKASLAELLRVQRSRWPIEQSYQQMKEELGLDHFEGRSWLGWHHHVTLVALAQAFLVTMRSAEARKSRKLPSVPNVRKWMQARVAAPLLNAVLDSEERRERKTRVIYLTQVFGIPVRMKRGRFEAPPLWELGEEL